MGLKSRLVLGALIGPLAATLFVFGTALSLLALLGNTYPIENVRIGFIVHLLSWHVITFVWAWRNWPRQ